MEYKDFNPEKVRKYMKELRAAAGPETVFKDTVMAGEFAHNYFIYKIQCEQRRNGGANRNEDHMQTNKHTALDDP